ncbi:MAG TPA: hypothetical protein DEQ30_02920 [Porphyromonadaceae bacterium]|nr:hypothetical protein [Porphyromonadaceae bacterium]
MNVIEVISAICGAGGILGVVSYFLFFKETKRIKKSEAKKGELDNWERQIERYEKRLQERDIKVDTLYTELRKEQEKNLSLLEQINNKELENKLLIIQKCEVRGCTSRKPPSDNY